MDPRNGYGRPRDGYGGSNTSLSSAPGPNPPRAMPGTMQSRAEKFEDEKRRIVDSCFSKKDEAGGLAESYITHIRIHEDSQYPQTPPPPDSAGNNKKERVIIVAVRNTGRVRMHKGRENSNGSFSIGKTWNLEDLSAINSFANAIPNSQDEAQRKEWAGDSGFTITLGKPYFWQAGTAKEKDFFIASLVKIYRKYTSGKTPELSGFSARELESIVGPAASRRTPDTARPPYNQLSNTSSPVTNGSGSTSAPPPLGQGYQRSAQSSQGLPPQPPAVPPGPRTMPSQENMYGNARQPVPQGRTPPPGSAYPPERSLRSQMSQDQILRPTGSREPLRPPVAPASFGSSQRNLTPQSSRSEMLNQRSESPDSSRSADSRPARRQGLYQNPPLNASFDALGHQNSSTDRFQTGGPGSTRPSRDQSPGLPARPSSSRDNRMEQARLEQARLEQARLEQARMDHPPIAPPERRRPPMTGRDLMQDKTASSASLVRPRIGGDGPASRFPTSQESIDTNASSTRGFSPTPSGTSVSDAPGMVPAPLQIHAAPLPRTTYGEPRAQQPTPPQVAAVQPQAPTTQPVPPPPRRRDVVSPAPATPKAVAVEAAPPPPLPEPEAPNSEESSQPASPEESEEFRPGLGPMFKKKTAAGGGAADKFRRAANAYGAFKPRAGGALDRLKKLDAPGTDQDGITGVFQAPKKPTPTTPSAEEKDTGTKEKESFSPVVQPPNIITGDLPQLTISSPLSPTPVTEAPMDNILATSADPERSATPDRPPSRSRAEEDQLRKRRRRSQYQAKYLSSLGIEATVIDGRAMEFDAILTDFGWGALGVGSAYQSKKLDVVEADLRRELGRVEAGSWLGTGVGSSDAKDERVEHVERLLDRAIQECDELEGLLTLYNVELSSLNDDIAFIEAQSQGLQVQTANQKLLQTELERLIKTVDVDPRQLNALRDGQIGSSEGLADIEHALLLLYKAMITIDPNMRSTHVNMAPDGMSRLGDNDLADMRALQEKKDRYISESSAFLDRMKQYMEFDFGRAFMDTEQANQRRSGTRLDVGTHDLARRGLWRYSALMLFAKEVDLISWDSLIRMYQLRAKNVYEAEIRNNVETWKKMTRKPSGDEADLLWTSADNKDQEGIAVSAKKITVKRSQTLARTLRSNSIEKGNLNEKAQIGRLYPYEAFAGAIEESAPLIFAEQNFIVDFFHASSTENIDFADAVMIAPPDARRGTNLMARKMVEPDRAIAGKIREIMDELMKFYVPLLSELAAWATKQWGAPGGKVTDKSGDPLQGIGIMQTLDRTMLTFEDTNQEFLLRALQRVRTTLEAQWKNVLEAQLKKIDDTKVKIKKRKGVIDFIRIFPNFVAAVESMLAPASDASGHGLPERTETRQLMDAAYERLNKQMFDSLRTIAKESPSIAAQGQQSMGVLAGADPEDKEALNYHILLIENMHHYLEEVEDHGDRVLIDWRAKAVEEYEEHLNLYVDSVVRRPMGKLMDYLDTTTPQLSLTPSIATSTGAGSTSAHTRSTLKKLLSNHDPKDMRKGVEALRKRIEKHFGDADDPSLSKALINKVLQRCEEKYVEVGERAETARREVFEADEGVSGLGWSARDVAAAFKGGK